MDSWAVKPYIAKFKRRDLKGFSESTHQPCPLSTTVNEGDFVGYLTWTYKQSTERSWVENKKTLVFWQTEKKRKRETGDRQPLHRCVLVAVLNCFSVWGGKRKLNTQWTISLWEGSRTGSECSPKLEVLQDSAFETNVVYEVNFQTVYLPIDLIFSIRCSSHFSFIRLSPIMFYPLISDAVRLLVTVENGCNRCSSIHRLKI